MRGDLEALVDLVAGGAEPSAVVDWLREAVDCEAVLATGAQPPSAAPSSPGTLELVTLISGHTDRVRHVPGDDWHTLVAPVGATPPRPLLWAWRALPWDDEDWRTVERAAGVAATLTAAARAAIGDAATMAARISALQALMAGDMVRASRALAPLTPQLVPAGAGQIAILEVPPGADRRAAARELDQHLASRGALVVVCPVDDRQVIIVSPGRHLIEDLTPMVGDGRVAGVSSISPWQRTAAAYRAASEALAAVRGTPAKIARHDGRAPLADLLHADARIWADLVLQPLSILSPADREDLLGMAREVTWWGESAAAELVGWHPSSLRRHTDRLANLIGHDRRQLWPSIALHLAVHLSALPPPPDRSHRPTLADILHVSAITDWAHQVVDPFPDQVREAVTAWLRSGTDTEAACRELGIARATLYRRLERARDLSHLEITRYPGATIELAVALYVLGHLPMGTVPDLADRRLTPVRGGEHMEIDTARPHPARVYNYLCGGDTNYRPDREQALRMLEYDPNASAAAQANRAFLIRAMEQVAAHGVTQVLDLGSGIPMAPHPHEVLLRTRPDSRVVYIDNDPIVLAHAEDLLRGAPAGQVTYVQADVGIGGPELLELPEVRQTLDLDKPVCLSAVALLHFLPGEPGPALVRDILDRLAPGSMLVLSHLTADFAPELVTPGVEQYSQNVAPLCTRSYSEVTAIFEGLEMLEPGIAPAPEWRPGADDTRPAREQANCWAGVGRTV
ncbi:SAM-dependent methyltransferase [Streptomyces sp. XM4193]|uniref:SAM-dependent methyltransferase n=1 Tax=Streptomyces sp. XM4193 TaxID=2929782 RepID=UPI001FFA7017|nr:SAM-dependent methyltransferase [Streptomyces sp. XM4193]MCK1794477.1 SAM-dependent methyltransferase [Streptomyces sp. XM4193]